MSNFRNSSSRLSNTKKNVIIYFLTFVCMFGIIIFLYIVYGKNDIVEKNINHTGDVSHSTGLKYNKKYLLVGVKRDNKYIMKEANATIVFYKDGTCLPSFDEMNQHTILPNNYNLFVDYNDSLSGCSYTISNDAIINIDWEGLYHYSSGESYNYWQSRIIDSGLIMNKAQFKYYPERDFIDVYNGKWDISFYGNEGYGVYIIKYVFNEN